MKMWQMRAIGEGFERSRVKTAFELSGFINAAGLDHAFSKAVAMPKAAFTELGQADAIEFPKPVINAEEIQEIFETENIETNQFEVHWYAE